MECTEIIVATGNSGKLREFKEILTGYSVFSMKEKGVPVDPEETGTTFQENAYIKAKALADVLAAEHVSAIAIADDSGLEIDAFGRAPGIYSARYLGHNTPYDVKNRIILNRMQDVPEELRTARYVAAIAAILPDGTVLSSHGTVEGTIAYRSEGEGGFGYDPIFFVPEYGKTMALLTPDEKNAISHRGKALRLIAEKIRAAQAES